MHFFMLILIIIITFIQFIFKMLSKIVFEIINIRVIY